MLSYGPTSSTMLSPATDATEPAAGREVDDHPAVSAVATSSHVTIVLSFCVLAGHLPFAGDVGRVIAGVAGAGGGAAGWCRPCSALEHAR